MNIKVFIPVLYCSAMLTTVNTTAQQVVNGGFEPATAIAPCQDIDVKVYNKNMKNNWAGIHSMTMEIADNSCGLGAPVAGQFFGVMKYSPPTRGNTITFKLDKPLTVNKAYSFILNYHIPASSVNVVGALRFGYAGDSTTTDSTSGVTDQITNTVWKRDTLNFTPQQPWQYIWLEISAVGGDPFTVYLDGVSMITSGTGINEITAANAIHVAPNPFTDNTVLTLDRPLSLPCHLAVYDVTGRIVLEQRNVQEPTITINKASIGTGIYMLKIIDSKQHIYTSKLSAQ